MIIDAGLLLRGCSLNIRGLGEVCSPQLKDIYSDFDTLHTYNLFRQLVAADSAEMRTLIKQMKLRAMYEMSDLAFDEAEKFDLIIGQMFFVESYTAGLRFFTKNTVSYNEEVQAFIIQDGDQIVGAAFKDNFDQVENVLSQLLHDSKETSADVKFASDTAKEWWEKANALEKATTPANHKDYRLSNLISKLACANCGYTLFNIYDLTVYQLYDQFTAYAQGRYAALCENAYAHNGGEDFDHTMWLHSEE